ncbi:MAG: spermidine synthase [Firmicutes bacterium]|nr:spermidine synthase [Bacillota bacterium]
MIIDQATTEHGEVVLRIGAAGYEIIVDGQFLISSASADSSVALVELGLEPLLPKENLQVCIGGLGLGYSLKTALRYREVQRVVVVELSAEIIDWHRRGLVLETAGALKDGRVEVINRDFLEFLDEVCARDAGRYDVIALDIDNGPDWLSHPGNFRLYSRESLGRIHGLLKPGGKVTFWSADPSPEFKLRLAQIFQDVTETVVNDHNGAGRVIPASVYVGMKG